MIFCFRPDAVIELNVLLVGAGKHRLLHRGALESALARPLHTFGGSFLFGTVVERAAALLDGLAQSHPFMDGNKRVAWLCAVMYLDVNGVKIRHMGADEAGAFVEEVVMHQHDVKASALWLSERII